MKTLLVVAFLSVAVFAGAPARAAPVDLSSGTGGFVGQPGTGEFSESWSFTLASPTELNVLLASVAHGGHEIDFSSIVLTGPSGPIPAALFTPGPFSTWTISGAQLPPGSYTLTANGTNSAGLGSFVGNIAVNSAIVGGTASNGGGPLDLSSGSAGFVSTPGAGAFSNTFSFSISTPQTVKLLLASALGGAQDLDFSSVVLRGPAGDLLAAEFTQDPFETWTLSTSLLAPGSYSVIASGINSAAMATYVGTLAVGTGDPSSPGNEVPEPGTGMLVLAGLGMVAGMRRSLRGRSWHLR